MKELNESELKQITGGDAVDYYIASCATASLVMIGLGLVVSSPVGIAFAVMGSAMGYSTTVIGIVKAFCGK